MRRLIGLRPFGPLGSRKQETLPNLRWTTSNCVLLCRASHQDVHGRILVIQGREADDPAGLVFDGIAGNRRTDSGR
jgi:hypothetical protein